MDRTETAIVFTKNLNIYLSNNNISQNELAKYVGVSNTTVNNWVKGYKTPRMDKVDKICDFLHISRGQLLEENIHNSNILSLSKEETVIIKKYRSLDERGKAAVNDTLNREYEFVRPKVQDDKVI
ncbi:helix-turn-helix domain-containing protein [Pectinatus frisingensis]|uniref:helix-turn-helix domain-containing protein n=1 Tax=Pectinatus frisingensis TaxID=865 RepID=UPI0018C60711|nr:XRE family transcriptional regulator [Pectinatus frisingensis]